ncbi:hypothetical protein RG836_18825 [Pseudomonas sp. SZMC_28357]|uniref:hypothetical protein n=1 Tax=Pseudomonas sp. SZMC_28357 TaxID=3074380 RepID=UPI0028714D39|nr:hypothetical protein [Pseudomonas sp. SZMC_28357]MDR9753506.1 hypothetical protein [Pseudomonas sp. SZMC_28357]
MIDIKLLYASVVCFLFATGFLNFAVMLYVRFFKLQEIEAYFQDCFLIASGQRTAGNGFYGRNVRLGNVRALLRDNSSIRPQLDAQARDDVRRFPKRLRLLIELPPRVNAGVLLGLIAVWSWGNYESFY